MCHIKIEPLCQVQKIFNKNQEIYQQILSWSLTSKIWGNKGLSKSLVWWLHPSLNIKFSLQLFGFVLIHERGKWGTDCLILTFLLGTIFTQVWRSGVTFFLMKQNQCLRPHLLANWSSAWKIFQLLESISYCRCKNISSAWLHCLLSSSKCAKTNRQWWAPGNKNKIQEECPILDAAWEKPLN